MNLFDVYSLFDIEPVRAEGSTIYDKNGIQYLDLYGGHAVISVGHSHPYYVNMMKEQLDRISFYSNSVKIPMQEELAHKLGELSNYKDYHLFLCNSGAEANENAFKLASFHNGRKKIIAFEKSFHGRTSLAVAATNDPSIQAAVNQNEHIIFLPFNDEEAIEKNISDETAAVIIEGIQGVGGVNIPSSSFLKKIRERCDATGTVLILDEIQSGYGRSGKFFAHQHADMKPDIITTAKGMGNGFPVAGVLIHPHFKAKHGMLGTTFGGNYLACTAAIAVLDIIKNENLIENAQEVGTALIHTLKEMEGVKEVRGQGLMIGIEFDFPCAQLRKVLLEKYKIFTGSSSDKNTLRILPSLSIRKKETDYFVDTLQKSLTEQEHLLIS